MKSYLENTDFFAENLKYYLRKNKVSQKELAKALDVSSGTVCDWCKGRYYPRMDKLEMIANHFNINKSDLVEPLETNLYKRRVNALAKMLYKNEDLLVLNESYLKLSDENKQIVLALINNLCGGDK